MIKKIGLAGKSGSGKDLIADYIADKYGYKKIAVADAIRDEANAFLQFAIGMEGSRQNLPPSFDVVLEAFRKAIWDKPTSPETRVLLQWWGTEYRRSVDPDYWIKKLAERLDNDLTIVVSDIRTPDEIRVVRDAGGEVWFIDRPNLGNVGIVGHYTEVALVDATFERKIINDGTIDELKVKVDSHLNSH